jgi:hypothetical protein
MTANTQHVQFTAEEASRYAYDVERAMNAIQKESCQNPSGYSSSIVSSLEALIERFRNG